MSKPAGVQPQPAPAWPELDRPQVESLARARDFYYTPDHVHAARRSHEEHKQKMRELGQAFEEGRRKGATASTTAKPKRRSSKPRGFFAPYGRQIRSAALKAKSTFQFCEMMDTENVPTNPKWQQPLWVRAYRNSLGSAIRGIILRARRRK